MGIFDQMLTNLVQMDFFQVLFPFLLALAIFYGVLKWGAKLDEKMGKGPTALVSIILAFFVMLYAKSIPGLSWMLAMASGSTLAIAVVLLFVIIILGLFGFGIKDIGERKNWFGLLIALIVVYAIVVSLWGVNISALGNLGIPYIGGADLWTIILFLVIIGIAWHFMTKEEHKPATPAGGAGGGRPNP